MKPLNQPLGGNEMPRFGGLASMMRLPMAATTQGLCMPDSSVFRSTSAPAIARARVSARARFAPGPA